MPRVIEVPAPGGQFIYEGFAPTSCTIATVAGGQGVVKSGTAMERVDGLLHVALGAGALVAGCLLDDVDTTNGPVPNSVVVSREAGLLLDLLHLPEGAAARWAVLEGLEALGLTIRDAMARPWREVVALPETEAVTEGATEASTELVTEAPETEAATEAPTEAETEEPTELPAGFLTLNGVPLTLGGQHLVLGNS